jgi:hypothetical protein
MGLMVELAGLGVRGLVKREDLPPGRWYFEGHRMAWTTPEGRILQSGMAVPLRIKAINRERRFVDFVVAAAAGEIPRAAVLAKVGKAARTHEAPKPNTAAKAGPAHTRTHRRQRKHHRRK